MARGFMSVVLFIIMLFSGCKTQNTDDIDGGVVHNDTDPDAPKTIESNEMVSFECEISFYGITEDDSDYYGRNYNLSAIENEGVVSCKIDWRGRDGEGNGRSYTTDKSFLEALRTIVIMYDIAGFNGHSHSVSGLPDMYGIRLDIRYSSGERIYIYNNQDHVIPLEAAESIVTLFCAS